MFIYNFRKAYITCNILSPAQTRRNAAGKFCTVLLYRNPKKGPAAKGMRACRRKKFLSEPNDLK
jgi:hypothetical protein